MQCAACGTENEAGSRFCMTCGSPIDVDGGSDSGEVDTIIPEPASTDAPGPPPGPAWGEEPESDAEPTTAGADADPFIPPTSVTPPPPPPGQVPTPPVDPTPAPGWGSVPTAPPPGFAGAPAPGAPPAPPAPVAPAWGTSPPPPTPPPAPAAAWGGAPAAPGYPVAPAPGGYPVAPVGPPDPNGLGLAAMRLGNGGRKVGRTALIVAGALLQEGEAVEAAVSGKFEGNGAVLVLTDRSLLLVDDRMWKPVSERFPVDASLQVQGWQDDRTASLTLLVGGRQLVLDGIPDRPLAVEMAQRIRYRVGA